MAKPWRRSIPYIFMGTVFILGFCALLLVIQEKLPLAGRVVLAAMVLAGIEYHFRKFSAGPSSMEDEFSALSDILCFTVVPGFLIYGLAFRGWGILGLIALFIIIFGGLSRLSLYKIYNPITVKRGFIGIPLTINAAFISLVAQLVEPGGLEPGYRLALLVVVIGLTFLTVSTIPYPNPADRPVIFLLVLLAVATIFLGPPAATKIAVWLLLVGGTIYIVIAPFGVKKG
jgi:phosphatidylserine synthase